MAKRTVLLFGNTLLIHGIHISLRPSEDLAVVHVESSANPLPEIIRDTRPDVFLFDLSAVRTDLVFDLLQIFPPLRVIGLDPQTNIAIEFSSQRHLCPSFVNLSQIILGG